MVELPFKPESAVHFEQLMCLIWDSDDGNLYEQWHDAHKVAQHLGLKRRGTSLRLGQWGPVYGFADGSGVYVSPSGAFVDAEVHDYKARKKNNNHELD